MEKIEKLAKGILLNIGGYSNIKDLMNCMTRVRFTLKDDNKLNESEIKKINGIMSFIKQGNQYQVVVGPGIAQSLREQINELKDTVLDSSSQSSPQGAMFNSKEVKAKMKNKYSNPLGNFFQRLGVIFIPMIPGFIAGGILLGIANILKNAEFAAGLRENYPNFIAMLSIFGGSVFFYLNAIVGYNASKEFGGTPIIGLMMAAIIFNPSLSGITLFGIPLVTGRGGIFAILFIAYFASIVEKFIRKFIPVSLDLFLTPTITLIVSGFVTVVLVQPLGGLLSDGITNGANYLMSIGGGFVGFLLASLFLPLVMTGIHQGLVPIMIEMISKTGVNYLLPILALAGAGQVGASIAVLVRTKNKNLKKIIESALPAGMLGIGEPLIYGVTLPLGKPFLASCIGGGFGGAVIGIFNVAAVIPGGASGLILTTAIVSDKILYYLLAVLVAYTAGFIATLLLGFDDPVEE